MVHILLKEAHDGVTTVHAVYEEREDLEARVSRIAKANSQYEMQTLAPNLWRIGPEEDEGFFGNKPIVLRAVEKEVL